MKQEYFGSVMSMSMSMSKSQGEDKGEEKAGRAEVSKEYPNQESLCDEAAISEPRDRGENSSEEDRTEKRNPEVQVQFVSGHPSPSDYTHK